MKGNVTHIYLTMHLYLAAGNLKIAHLLVDLLQDWHGSGCAELLLRSDYFLAPSSSLVGVKVKVVEVSSSLS